ncbi:Terpene synthase, metal-binding domain [Sesbania bispinosa]|nr:Terpene synthase, metal-binding domain [Sesbania bispinosa]
MAQQQLFTNNRRILEHIITIMLMDDIVSNEFEQKRGHVCSFLECYTKQYGKSMEDAIHECRKRTANAWKDINEEFLRPTEVPMLF